MFSWRMGMSRVTGSAYPAAMSGVSLDGVLEWPSELGVSDDPDCLDSRPPATVSSCSSILKEGIVGCAIPGMGLRLRECVRLSVLERLDRLVSKESADRSFAASVGIGGNALVGAGGAGSAMAMVTWKAASRGLSVFGDYICLRN